MNDREIHSRIASRFRGRWVRGYVSSKLATDPLYRAVWERLADSPLPVLDIGCGLGLLGFYLRERGFAAEILGLDSDRAKLDAAREGARLAGDSLLRFEARSAIDDLEFEGNVVLADVIHYLRDDDQRTLLNRVASIVPPGGLAIIRDCPRDRSLRHAFTWMEEVFARGIGWMRTSIINFPTRDSISSAFRDGFDEDISPLWGRTPFNSHLFVYRRREG